MVTLSMYSLTNYGNIKNYYWCVYVLNNEFRTCQRFCRAMFAYNASEWNANIYYFFHICLCTSFLYHGIYSFVHPFIHPSIYSSMHPSIYSSIHPFIHVFTYPSNHQFIHPSIYPSIHVFIYSSIHPFIHVFINQSIYPSIHPSTHPFIHSFMYSRIHLTINSFIHPSIHSSIHSFINSFIHLLICSCTIHVFIYPSINSSIHPLIHPFTHPFTHTAFIPSLFNRTFINPFSHQSIYRYINLFGFSTCIYPINETLYLFTLIVNSIIILITTNLFWKWINSNKST